MWAILLIIAGIVLKANDEWFNGAETVGTVCLLAGIGAFILWLVFFVVALAAAGSQNRGFSRKSRRW